MTADPDPSSAPEPDSDPDPTAAPEPDRHGGSTRPGTLPDPGSWPVDPDPGSWRVEDLLGGRARDLLRERATASPDRLALIDAETGDRYSYAELDDRVSALSGPLAGLCDEDGAENDGADGDDGAENDGVEDARVGLLMGTRVAFAEMFFAVGRVGAAAVGLNVELPDGRLRSQARRAGLDCLVCEAATEDLATAVAPADAGVASVDHPTEEGVGRLAPDPGAATGARERRLDAERVVLFTSGTTGEPKGVGLTTGNLVASAVGSADRLGVDPGDRWLVCLPTYHMGGLAPILRSTLYGTTAVIQRSFDADATARVLSEYGVTGVSLVPTMLKRLLDAGWQPADYLRFVLLGGAPAPGDLLGRATDRDVPVYPTYGTTETASQVATATPAEVREHPDTVGRPLSVTEVTVVSEGGDPVPAGDWGELVVSGPTVTPGYLDDGHTAAAFDDRGFHTGDLGYRNPDGRLWVVGRIDDRIHTGGENVSAARVAEVLCSHPGVGDAAVVGIPDEEWGERVGALVVPGGDAPATEALREYARDRLAAYAVPKTLAVADDLPRTTSGTVDRDAVREWLRDGED